MNIIEAAQLTKNYNGFTAVKRASFSVTKGEIFGFLGPNGAGKTTTINMLTGLARPSSGSIQMAGEDGIKDIKKVQQLIGIVPDESNLYDEMSGLDNLIFCASLYGIDKVKRETRAKQLLEQFGLTDTGSRPFKAYSKGMKRKLTIAAGIIHEPEILFLDEPTTGIDVESARQIRKLVLTLNNSGTTIFLTTHYIEEAERLCHRIGFIVGGEIVKIGTTGELMQEAQRENAVEFVFDNNTAPLNQSLTDAFPDIRVHKFNENVIRIFSRDKIDLMPFMKHFDEKNVLVREARIIRPSLEEIFVKVTGIKIANMKKEKEGGRKK
ncbi:ABC transporter ATP-binding protein [Candidatus Contubernalis alkaliaceticus]|uniref:ABC transporter ATP-binding protein n=1 Tax=Candidatus Contubernalis alkaliaceticus TaxID=338645 RepID=UPI001F4C4FB7|nr:ABC transporter ATP-binding protein [Candidatus Contubernalis alkalaceticus]UNC93053.1 ABC transporter ATP-binding protein [Candidatus Contubernalis alkalaceticus]